MTTQLFTDIHIRTKVVSGVISVDVTGSLFYPGPVNSTANDTDFLTALLESCKGIGKPDFMIDHEAVFYRVRRDENAVDGIWYRLRRMADIPPKLETLPSPLPQQVQESLLSPVLLKGGLILITGGPGSGKTTTASATVISRLLEHGGVAYTVEDPPELPLNGRHGTGYCTQTSVAGEKGEDWVESMRGVLRSQPVGTPLMMYVGEIRDADAARVMLRAASNGFLVICTTFGTDIISSIDSLFQLVGLEYVNTIAQLLRVVLFQDLKDGRLKSEVLVSDSGSIRVASIIRSGKLAQLQDEITAQRNQMIASYGRFQTRVAA